MKRKLLLIKIPILIAAVAFLGAPLQNVDAALSSWQKGATIYSNWNEEFASDAFKQSLRDLKSTNANYVSLVIPLYQSNLQSTDVQSGGNTPTDTALISAINYAHSIGLKVMLKPHLDSFTGEWRANINPTNRTAWFNSYSTKILKYAQIAAQYKVEDFCIGTELISMADPGVNSTNTQNWRNLIASVRGVYTGKITYSANWGPAGFTDEKNHIQFWNNLDYIGISAYFNMSGDSSVANLKNQWSTINSTDIAPLSQKWAKPVVFTEIGYRSVVNGHRQPWDYSLGGAEDQQGQANAYQALFDFWNGQSSMQGVQLWDWSGDPNAGWSGTGYTPQHKLAQKTMTTWFGTASTPPPAIGNPNFVTSSSASPDPIVVGQPVDIVSNVTNNGAPVADIIVDVEVYNSSGQKIFQKYYDTQAFPQGQARTYHTSWTPPSAGTYTVKLGVFNYNWSQNYVWVDKAMTLSTSGSTTPPPTNPPPTTPPPTSTSVNIWWPTNGSSIGGNNVPFKAMLENMDVANYDMYWQVDGGTLVLMPTNNTDYPHKEFVVDVTNWTWQGSGTYHLNFIAKNKSGVLITQKAIDVTVWH